MRPSRNLGVLVGAALLASGCFSWLPWGSKKVDPDAPAELTSYKAEVKIDRIWGASVGEGLGKQYMRLPPAILAERVFAADGFGYVEARDRFSGKRIWKARIGSDGKGFFSFLNPFDRTDYSYVTGGVGAGEGLVLLGTTKAEVIALSAADGSPRWRVPMSSEVLAAPSTGEGLVFVQTSDGRLVALEARDGARRWTFDTQVPVLSLRGTGSPQFASGVVVAGFANGKVTAFRAASGEPLWDARVMLPQGRSELDRMADVDGDPVITSNAVYAASFQGRVTAIRPSDGTALWEREASTYVDLGEGGGRVYVVDDKSVITAYDERTANVAWEQRALFKRDLTGAAAIGDYVIVGDSAGFVHVLAQSDGHLVGRRKIDGGGIRSRPVVGDDVVYVMGNSGDLAALRIKPIKKG